MKTLLGILITGLLMAGCSSTKTMKTSETVEASGKAETKSQTVSLGADEDYDSMAATAKPEAPKTMLVGIEERSELTLDPFGKWFNPNYEKYVVKSKHIPELTKALKDVQITTYMGTWCGDSKRETPRFFKILDEAQYDEFRSAMITVNRKKVTPDGLTEGANIIRVPTFIFKKNGKELGRIVERPVESLEEDMLKILNGEPYKHSYEK